MKKFTLGAIAGASTLAMAFPIVAQVTSAAASSSSPSNTASVLSTVPSQECVLAMATLEGAHLDNFDAMTAAQKQSLKIRKDALSSAASIADETARGEVLKKMHEDMKASKTIDNSMPAAITKAMEAVRTACGNTMRFMPGGSNMLGMNMGHGAKRAFGFTPLAEKFGITEDELKTELANGKTIDQIAKEHSVTLPDMGERKMYRMHHMMMKPTASSSSLSSAQ
jgi:hypothetical protein